jgi:DNA-binding HxlR family transcriptional regulator
MFFERLAKRRKMRVLLAASEGVLSLGEIALRARVSKFRTKEVLRDLESEALLVSAELVPIGLRVYRLTSKGQRELASGVSI